MVSSHHAGNLNRRGEHGSPVGTFPGYLGRTLFAPTIAPTKLIAMSVHILVGRVEHRGTAVPQKKPRNFHNISLLWDCGTNSHIFYIGKIISRFHIFANINWCIWGKNVPQSHTPETACFLVCDMSLKLSHIAAKQSHTQSNSSISITVAL